MSESLDSQPFQPYMEYDDQSLVAVCDSMMQAFEQGDDLEPLPSAFARNHEKRAVDVYDQLRSGDLVQQGVVIMMQRRLAKAIDATGLTPWEVLDLRRRLTRLYVIEWLIDREVDGTSPKI